jgi:hypothetical protein
VELGGWFIFAGDAATVFDAHPETLWSRWILKTEGQSALGARLRGVLLRHLLGLGLVLVRYVELDRARWKLRPPTRPTIDRRDGDETGCQPQAE